MLHHPFFLSFSLPLSHALRLPSFPQSIIIVTKTECKQKLVYIYIYIYCNHGIDACSKPDRGRSDPSGENQMLLEKTLEIKQDKLHEISG